MDIDAEVAGDTLDGTVAAVIMDPPYNTRSARNSPNSDHDKLSLDDMRNVVEMCDRLLKPGGGTESSSLPCSSSATGTSTWQSSRSMSRKERNRSPWRSRCPLYLMWRRCLWFASERRALLCVSRAEELLAHVGDGGGDSLLEEGAHE